MADTRLSDKKRDVTTATNAPPDQGQLSTAL
jgi:hypothetical protein